MSSKKKKKSFTSDDVEPIEEVSVSENIPLKKIIVATSEHPKLGKITVEVDNPSEVKSAMNAKVQSLLAEKGGSE